MNCVNYFLEQTKVAPNRPAVWMNNQGIITFKELSILAGQAQALYSENGIKKGDSVVVFEKIGHLLYASIIGLLALGVTTVIIEPWMQKDNIDQVVKLMKPKMFLSNFLGHAWGKRIKAIRSIPNWTKTKAILNASKKNGFHVESIEKDTPAIVTFTSGTTGSPKGVVRNHDLLERIYKVTAEIFSDNTHTGPDLCIFANFILINLAAGRTSIIIPHHWPTKVLKNINSLPDDLQPESIDCGPAFLKKIIKTMPSDAFRKIKEIKFGGAQTDCHLLEQGFKKWPDAQWHHVYGCSEAAPIAFSDARLAVAESKKRNFFQTLFLGQPIKETVFSNEKQGLWVTGPHVCPLYLGNDEANRNFKRCDESGNIWHLTGDRINIDEKGWWYAGRANQNANDFFLEQKIYTFLNSSKSFIYRDKKDHLFLIGENLKKKKKLLLDNFKELEKIIEAKIYFDKRHRAKIDRNKSLKKGENG